ncbi:MAG: hypothetical protein HN736_11115 [Anaerolineae bacterium]|jgi:hypothetical protein|nr:hypothetical protein [Anaerolineae bacterium]MBT4310997.1 hypothetical protein [Anaerolineae bacterium]MBT4459713.1 hypothetical protein [Anaerolineae bacterium]MBT4841857.1 hypothetical protein [Anaerolineae bacterium]MBT6061240.1 hypothetical protein [Anaerolineae bacterium]
MPQQQIACPQCRQPILANIELLFDITSDPGAKQRLLGGAANVALCQSCGFQGQVPTPVIYHDNEKDLLLTFFPPELAIPVNEQEQIAGPQIKKLTDKLPAEKRKGYLLNPQTFFTYESMLERILGEDGITPEMIKAQKDRIGIVEKLLTAKDDEARKAIIKENQSLFDEQFFGLFGQLGQAATAQGQSETAEQMKAIEQLLLDETEYGQQIQSSMKEMEAAAASLQELGEGLTREKLLDLIIDAPNEEREQAFVSMARQGLDYEFFQLLTNRAEAEADAEKRGQLEAMRERVLTTINEMDRQMEARMQQAQGFLNSLLEQEDIGAATQANLQNFNQGVVQALEAMLHKATEEKDEALLAKLQQVVAVLQQASGPLPEYEFIEELLAAEGEEALEKVITENEDKITEDLLKTLGGVVAQQQGQEEKLSPQDKEMFAKMEQVYGAVLKYSMKKNMG